MTPRHFLTRLRTLRSGAALPLLVAWVLVGCSSEEALELKNLEVTPDPARAGSSLSIEFLASRAATELPQVTVAGEAAMAKAKVGAGDGAVRYVFGYEVEGDEQEGEVPVVASAMCGTGKEVTIEGTAVFDFTSPSVTILTGPNARTWDDMAIFTFKCSKEHCVFACSLQADLQGMVSAPAECESGIEFVDLSRDEYTFTLEAIDLAGNVSEPAEWFWTREPPPVTSLVVSGVPSPVDAGTVSSLTIEAVDDHGDRAVEYAGTVSFSSTDAHAELPSNYTFSASDEAVVTLSGAVVLRTAGVHSLTATDTVSTSITGSQDGIEVQSASPVRLAFKVQPTDVVQDEHMMPAVEVAIGDAFGNLVPGATGNVTLMLQGGDPSATLTGGAAGTTEGVAVFSELAVDRAGNEYSFVATSDWLESVASPTFDVLPRPTLTVVFPGRTWPGNPWGFDVEVLGAGFSADVKVVWDAGGQEVELGPSSVESDKLEVALVPELWSGRVGAIPLVAEQHGVRSLSFDFMIGGVLPDTGQTACYSASDELVNCPVQGDALFGQDAQYGWDLLFEPEARFAIHGTTGNPIVLDQVTQLDWQGCTGGRSGLDCGLDDEIEQGWEAAVAYCQGLSWGEKSDWRLPTVNELSSVINLGAHDPSVHAAFFPETPPAWHWSSSESATDETRAFYVSFEAGAAGHHDKDIGMYARCVRGDAGPEAVLYRTVPVQGQPIVRDVSSGLVWQGCSVGQEGDDCGEYDADQFAWADALVACEDLVWAEHDDWRLPSRNELQSILDFSSVSPIDLEVFPNTPMTSYWSSSSEKASPSRAWYAFLGQLRIFARSKNDAVRVRCVRGGVTP